jgi:hypothetical protein
VISNQRLVTHNAVDVVDAVLVLQMAKQVGRGCTLFLENLGTDLALGSFVSIEEKLLDG